MAKANVTICRPAADGSGSALRLDMHYQTAERSGFIRFAFAAQDGTEFDFDDAVDCDLDFAGIANVLGFLCGKTESFCNGEPAKAGEDTFFAMKKENGEYILAACQKRGEEIVRRMIALSAAEAEGIRGILESSLFYVAFIKGVNP